MERWRSHRESGCGIHTWFKVEIMAVLLQALHLLTLTMAITPSDLEHTHLVLCWEMEATSYHN